MRNGGFARSFSATRSARCSLMVIFQNVLITSLKAKMRRERISFERDGVRLGGTLFTPQVEAGSGGTIGVIGDRAVCLCHGIPRVAKTVEEKGYGKLAELFCERGVAALIFNFSGTAGSGGYFSLRSWSADLRAAVNFLLSERGVRKVGVVAFSGGAAVAVYNAAHDARIKVLAACSCPAALRLDPEAFKMFIREHGSLRVRDVNEFIKEFAAEAEEMKPLRWIRNVKQPLLIMHGELDELVNVKDAYELFRAAGSLEKELFIVEGAGHRIRENNAAMRPLADWVTRKLLR
ncbi:MAG: Dipeptidyl aminopeptidase/acylaminoacyl peptidase [Candidatus Alkanophagales archaeon MCA70_species_1]|nr:Dipeptidyl aminopeptidase/acylaminoacyl peptidase [Candidatus Alkanophaga volatiphilum]